MALEVLVVDDEADIRDLVSGVLEDEGYSVRTAADSTSALEAMRDRRPSLLLLDVWLQGSRLDGLQLLQEVKRVDPSLPVLIISGDNDGLDKIELIKTYQLLGGAVFADMGAMPKSQLAIVPSQTHVGLMMQTSTILTYLNGFLK